MHSLALHGTLIVWKRVVVVVVGCLLSLLLQAGRERTCQERWPVADHTQVGPYLLI